MAEVARDERGRFTSGGSSAHTSATGHRAGKASDRARASASEHDKAAQGHKGAAAARRAAAAKEPDPARKSEHLAAAAHHDARAAHHEAHAAAHAAAAAHHEAGEKGGGLAKYLEKAKEGIARRGESANKLAEQALEENGLSKAAGEAAFRAAAGAATGPLERVGGLAERAAKAAESHEHHHGKHE